MSDSVRPHRQQPTRLPCPWDSPGMNTGVGCHFLLQCMKVKSESEGAQSCLTLCDPIDGSPPGSPVHGIFQARVLEWGAIAFSIGWFWWGDLLCPMEYGQKSHCASSRLKPEGSWESYCQVVWTFYSWLGKDLVPKYLFLFSLCQLQSNVDQTQLHQSLDSSPTSWFQSAAKSLQSCLTLCDPIDGSPPGSLVPGVLQARTLEWAAISFSKAWKWKVKVKSLSHVWLLATPWTTAYQAPPSMGFSRQEYWSGVPFQSRPA